MLYVVSYDVFHVKGPCQNGPCFDLFALAILVKQSLL